MMEINLSYNSQVDFDGGADSTELPLMVSGMSCKGGYIASKHFIIPFGELDNIAKTLKEGIDGLGAYILKDHGFQGGLGSPKSVDKLVGRITDAERAGEKVFYSGRIEDEDMASKIRKKLVTTSSVGLRVNKMFCSICGLKYGHEDCGHRLGKEYPNEGLHKNAKDYMDKSIAAIVGADIEGREQAIVLFPAIAGASVGANLSFGEDLQNLITETEGNKVEPEILEEPTTKELMIELGKEIGMILVDKDEYDTLIGKLETAKEVIQVYKDADERRLSEERAALVEEINDLRWKMGLDEKDYSKASLDVIMEAHENINSVSTMSGGQGFAGRDRVPSGVLDGVPVSKDDIRELMSPKHDTNIRKTGRDQR